MPPKPKRSREQVVEAAVELIRRSGPSGLTARALGSQLGVAASSLFTHFESMDALRDAARESIRSIYNSYVEQGLAMNPPFKGFGMAFLRFADEEPRLFSALFLEPGPEADLRRLIDHEGHRELILSAIGDTFAVSREISEKVYSSLWVYLCGLSTLLATGVCSFTEEERSEHLGNACRSFLLSALAPEDERVTITPKENQVICGSVSDYLGQSSPSYYDR